MTDLSDGRAHIHCLVCFSKLDSTPLSNRNLKEEARERLDAEAGSLKVRGKGRKERLAYACEGATEALADWLKVRPDEPGPLLLPVRKGGAIQSGRMSTQAVYEILRSRASKAGVKQFSPHDLRRTFVGSLLDAGADVSVVSKLAGHASVTTTARYDRRGEKAKRKAASLLHVPYRRRL